MKKEKVIISSLIPTIFDSYTIDTGINLLKTNKKNEIYDISKTLQMLNIGKNRQNWIKMERTVFSLAGKF